jgi:hypothetical protein
MQWDVDVLDKINMFHQWSRLVMAKKKVQALETMILYLVLNI